MIKFFINTTYKTLVFFSLIFSSLLNAQTEVSADGKQAFCIGESKNIVTDFSITNPDASVTGVAFFYIQISSGYQVNEDKLDFDASKYPNISKSWNSTEGKLTLSASSPGTVMLFSDLEKAVKEVVFTTSATIVEEVKTFSLTIDNANYLLATDHFYEFVADEGITWTDAKIAAENRPLYYGRKGYLATLTSEEEADFAGKQASSSGWIGATDAETEGVWKWVTGPEAGTVFWNGKASGSSPAGQYAKWNNNEPNDTGGNEDYAHITDPSIGIPGAWNDLPNGGGVRGPYFPKGYIVEYGAPGDPPLKIVATTSIYIPQITSISNDIVICESGTITLTATSDEGEIIWYNSPVGGRELHRGSNYTFTATRSETFYAAVSVNGCTTLKRTGVEVIVTPKPTITNITEDLICSGIANLSANASEGTVNWYYTSTSPTPFHVGNDYKTPPLNSTTTYYVEADNMGCLSADRKPITATVDSVIPEFDLVKNNYFLCNDVGSIVLETENALDIYTYVWKKDNSILSGSLSSIKATEIGSYTVKAISNSGCESIEKTILVLDSEIATININDIFIIDDSDNNTLEVVNANLGVGDYEFSLDDEFGVYKNIGFFEKISTGSHILFIRDKNGCGTTQYQFSILAYPKYFTPNGDGKNDFWKIDGFESGNFTVANVSIYNRFGVLLYQATSSSEGWDGRYQGKILASNTYWYRIILTDNTGRKIEKTGSIGLIRK